MIAIPPWSADDPWPDNTTRLLLVGPPGTGKTRAVLDAYVLPLLRDDLPLLATSYTRAAASELRERTSHSLGRSPDAYRSILSTMHSEASRRCAALKLTLERRHKAKDDDQERVADERDVTEVHRRSVEDGAKDGLAAWEKTRHRYPEDIGLEPVARLARILSGERLQLAAAEVKADLDGRSDNGRVVRPDFTGLLELALTSGADRSLHLLAIDEAQDLTPLEWALVDRWANSARRLLVVGDPDQAIYGWAGADGARLVRWLRDRRPARRLEHSWRVPKTIHRLARHVIADVHDRVDAPYSPADRCGSVRSLVPDDAWLTAASTQSSGQQVLVLSRTRKGASHAVDELLEADVPHIAERGRAVLGAPDRPSILLSVCRALWDIAARRPVPCQDLRRLVACLDARGPCLAGQRGLKTRLGTLLTGRHDRMTSDELDEAGLDVELLIREWDRATGAWWRSATLASRLSVGDLLIIRDWTLTYGEDLFAVANHVRVTTCHGANGREADLVVLDARARWGWRAMNADDRDEDRRVLYVALTRTRDQLVVIRGTKDWLDQHGLTTVG